MAQAGDDGVARFVALTGSSTDQAAFMLEATHGNFEQAVQMYFGKWPPLPNGPDSAPRSTCGSP